MLSLSDTLLAAAVTPQMEAVHGETVTMLSGDDAGVNFTGIITIESDLVLLGGASEDRRGKRTITFFGTTPRITGHSFLRDAAGRTWKAIRQPGDNYLGTDFELVNVTSGDL